MRKINLLLVTLFLVGITTTYYLWNFKNDDNKIIKPKETVIELSNKVEQPNNSESIQDKHKQNKTKSSNLKKILVERVQAFNLDPAVDAILIKINLSHCIKIINAENHKNKIESWKSINKKNEDQIKFKQDLNIYCEELNKKHPEYMLTNEDDIKTLSESITSDDETGKILSGFYNDKNIDLESFDIASKIQHLKKIDPNLLFNASFYFKPYLVEKFQYDVGELIKSKDSNYVSLVRKGALDLYACNAGANCGRYSNMLTNMCLNRNLCGNDFNDIVTNKMPLGIRLDILLVYKHIKNTFD